MTLPTHLASAMSQIDSALRYIPAPNKGEVSGPLVNAKKCMESVKNSLENYVLSLEQNEKHGSNNNDAGAATNEPPAPNQSACKGGQYD